MTTQKQTFFTFAYNRTSDSYLYSVFTTSYLDIGNWNIKCTASLNQYPQIKPVLKTFSVKVVNMTVAV